jgi:carbon-monoxide dehydrogenase medium subunit
MVRIAIGPAGGTPQRAYQTETILAGKKFDNESIRDALEAIHQEIKFRTSPHRASAEYRRHLSGILLEIILPLTWNRTYLTAKQ